MKQILNQIVLIIYCFLGLLFFKIDFSFVAAFLFMLTLTSSIYFFRLKKYTMTTGILYFIAGFFLPELYLFLPAAIYQMFSYEAYLPVALLCVGTILHYLNTDILLLCILLFGTGLSGLLAYHACSYETLDAHFRKTRDDSTELNLLLKEKNQNLLDKQDYEIYTATLRERNRIAREIHDNVGHMLSRSILMVGALKAASPKNPMAESLTILDETLKKAMDNIRTSVHDLHDDSVNLQESLEKLIHNFQFCSIDFNYDMGYEIPRSIKYCFIAITKEALSNISRHSNASSVHVTAREHPGFYQLLIEDNGTNIQIRTDRGIGLINMKDRASSLNGSIQITQDKGFRIFVTIPKSNQKG